MATVADMIDERDREGLEATLARVFFDLSGARALNFWRVRRASDGFWLKRRVALPSAGNPFQRREEEVALAAAPEPLRLACETRDVATSRARRGRPFTYVMPVDGDAGVRALIEISTAQEIDRERIGVFGGLLRIYRSHLAALDYGEVDELTRLANRRTFDDQFGRFAFTEARCEADGSRAHLGVVDIDFFKQINDRFGHPYGDEVLVLFAGLMRDRFRETDRLFRFGGEEFVILMSHCDAGAALAAFDRFRAAVEAHRFPQVGRVTVSIGVTRLQLQDTGSAAFGRADQALYVAKRSGRNRVLSFEALEESLASQTRRAPAQEVELF